MMAASKPTFALNILANTRSSSAFTIHYGSMATSPVLSGYLLSSCFRFSHGGFRPPPPFVQECFKLVRGGFAGVLAWCLTGPSTCENLQLSSVRAESRASVTPPSDLLFMRRRHEVPDLLCSLSTPLHELHYTTLDPLSSDF